MKSAACFRGSLFGAVLVVTDVTDWVIRRNEHSKGPTVNIRMLASAIPDTRNFA
jgi:hypothetical protein